MKQSSLIKRLLLGLLIPCAVFVILEIIAQIRGVRPSSSMIRRAGSS